MKKIFDEILCLLKRSNILIAIGLILIVLGIILGVCFELKEPFLSVHNDALINYYNKIFCVEISPFSLLIERVFNCVLVFIPIFFFSFNKFTFYLSYLIVFYRGFVLGFALRLFLTQISISGAVIFLLLIFIQALFLAFSIILFMCLTYNRINKINNITLNLLIRCLIVSLIFSIIGAIIEFLLITLLFRPIVIHF